MNGFSRLAYVETKLFLRETGAAIGVFGLPVALVIGFGLIPGFGDPQKGLSGQIGTEYIASISVAIVLAVLGLTGVPMVIGQYRERGILRRLGVTPVRPLTLLLADLMVWAAAAILSVALVIGGGPAGLSRAGAAPGGLVRPVAAARHRRAVLARHAGGRGGADGQEPAGLGWLLFFPNMFLGRRLLPDRGDVAGDAPDRELHPARLGPARGAGQLDGPDSAARIPGHNGSVCRDRRRRAARFFRWEQA